ncbi:MAG: hypothetical protein JNK58_00835 [Phycisphaerae bacterium]|nr:hypothetical protein [Phycisphaerae bacterium]
MNVTRFLEHWSIRENPFKAEEARHDAVFARLHDGETAHPDFEKIIGDLTRPSASIVFGEKGSGKTAIRIQIAERIARHNALHPDARVLLVPYDDLNPFLDRFCAEVRDDADKDGMELLKRLKSLRLADHLDGILHVAVPRVIDAILDPVAGDEPGWRVLRKASVATKRDAQLLQALYDRHEEYESRAALLRRRIAVPWNRYRLVWKGLAVWGWLPAAAVGVASFFVTREWIGPLFWLWALGLLLAAWAVLLFNWFVLERIVVLKRKARRVGKKMRIVGRSTAELCATLEFLPPEDRTSAILPADDGEERRFALLARLRRVIQPLGYAGIIIIVDRVDEPSVISGDADSMRAVVWPLLNNKFLQQEGVGVKLLLPVELRHELFRESSAFFQGARLDKQNLIERLTWSGAALYDLCNGRLRACQTPDAAPVTIADLFDDEVSRQDIVDALEQMHQPRDAFKLLYQCMQEHCSNITEDQQKWRIPRPVLDSVRKQQAERVMMLQRGYRPA